MQYVQRLISIACLVLYVSGALAETATVTWTHPTQRVDGSALALADIKSTRIAYGLCPATTTVVDVPAPATTWTSPPLGYGTWCFKAATVDLGMLVSDYTGVVQKTITAPPKPPTIVTVNIVVWDVRWNPGRGTVLGRAVGTVPLGTECGAQRITVQGQRQFHEVPLDVVTLDALPASAIVVAQCEVSG